MCFQWGQCLPLWEDLSSFFRVGVEPILVEGSIQGHVLRGKPFFLSPAFLGAYRDAPTKFRLPRCLRLLKRSVIFGVVHFFGGGCFIGGGDLRKPN